MSSSVGHQEIKPMPLTDAHKLRLPYLLVTLLAWGACGVITKESASSSVPPLAALAIGITNLFTGGLAFSARYSASAFRLVVHPSTSLECISPTLFIMGFLSVLLSLYAFAYT
jgi:hypothetical protein